MHQEILDLLREQGPDGMSAREIAATLPKNYHTTRSLLRKMEDAGEVRHANGRYLAVSAESRHNSQWPPLSGYDHKEQEEKQPPVDSDYDDDSDYGDDAIDISHDSFTERCYCFEGTGVHQVQESISACEDVGEKQQEHDQRDPTDILRNQRHHRHHYHHHNQMYKPTSAENVQGASSDGTDNTVREKQTETFLQRNRCPHAQLVRFDPAGQAWCDKLDCWDSYRLMKIGEALEYCCLTDLCRKVVIEQGIAAWSDYVRAPRPFLVVVATGQAIVLCKEMGIEVPDVSGEVKRLIEVRSASS